MNEKLRETLDEWLAVELSAIHTALPGRVVSYSGHRERRATVVPCVRPHLPCGEVVEIQPIFDVPVIMPCTAEAGVLLPLKAGSGVLLLFTEAGMGHYLAGRAVQTVDADDPTRFSLHDCVAIPGLYPFGAVPKTPIADDEMALVYGNSSVVLKKDRTIINGNLEVLA